MDFKLKWKQKPRAIIDSRVLRNGKTALFMAETWRRLYNPFVPMDTGFLANDSVTVSSRGSVGYIHHNARYAAPIYFGRSFNFSTQKHSLASAEWDKAARSAGRVKTLVRDTDAYIRSGRGN